MFAEGRISGRVIVVLYAPRVFCLLKKTFNLCVICFWGRIRGRPRPDLYAPPPSRRQSAAIPPPSRRDSSAISEQFYPHSPPLVAIPPPICPHSTPLAAIPARIQCPPRPPPPHFACIFPLLARLEPSWRRPALPNALHYSIFMAKKGAGKVPVLQFRVLTSNRPAGRLSGFRLPGHKK